MMAATESAAMNVVLRCHRPDGEFQDRSGGCSILSFGSDHFSEPPAGGCSKVVFIEGVSRVALTNLPAIRVNP